MGEWISVEDKLPENEKLNVVRYCRRDNGKHLGIALSHYSPSMVTGDYDFDFNRGTQQTIVTHWMPLPPPPETNNG